MKVEYHKRSKVNINMIEYLNKILDDLPENYQGRAITPAENHIFEIKETAHKLSERDAQAFHTIAAKLLFL